MDAACRGRGAKLAQNGHLLRELLRRARYTQPFNALATHGVRAACGALGLRSEWAIRHLHHVGRVRSRLPNGRDLVLWSRADDWVSN